MERKDSYRSISIKQEFADSIEEFIRQNPEHGYRSIAQFLEDSSRRRLEELEEKQGRLPRMEQVNCDENGVKIFDRDLHRVIEVSIKPSGIRCEFHQTENCEHVEFAKLQREVQKIVRQRRKEGWKLENV